MTRHPPSVPLEDCYEDIVGKAQRGLHLSDSELMERAGVGREALRAARRGTVDEDVTRLIAPHLGLHSPSLLAIGNGIWYPETHTVDGLIHVNTPAPIPGYEAMTVNSYILHHPTQRNAILFDMGEQPDPILDEFKQRELNLQAIFITHTHGDHVTALPHLLDVYPQASVYSPLAEHVADTTAIGDGNTVEAAGLRVEARLTPGHSPGGTSYLITGLSRPVVITGDALFAGSIGGVRGNYEAALEAIRSRILSLSPDTVVCPGHGPLSSVGEERDQNPFFASL